VIVAEVMEAAELEALTEGMLDELQANRLLLVAAEGVPHQIPDWLAARSTRYQISSLSLSMSALHLGHRALGSLFKRIRVSATAGPPSHYTLVSRLHLSMSDMGGDAAMELQGLLSSNECALRSLDVSSCTELDCGLLVQAFRSNRSLTALDVRNVPSFLANCSSIADVLLNQTSACRLGFLRCDAFDMVEGQELLSLHETPLEPAMVRLIAGLVKRNDVLRELDLCATDLEISGATAIACALEFNSTLSALRLTYNPRLEEKEKIALFEAAERHKGKVRLEV